MQVKGFRDNSRRPLAVYRPGWQFWTWLAAALTLLLTVVVVCTAWTVRHALVGGARLTDEQSRMVLLLARFPGMVSGATQELISQFKSDPVTLLVDRNAVEQPHWVRRFPAANDPGYLLFAGVSPSAKHPLVEVIRIADGKAVARWDPDWHQIFKQTTSKKFAPAFGPNSLLPNHPLLLPDGDIVFNTTTALVRMGVCSSRPVWVLDEVMHHSNELDANGDIWVPTVSTEGLADSAWLRDRVRDDALARVSQDGKLLERRSFAGILRANGLQALLLGTSGLLVNEDPIHLNEIKVAPGDSQYWRRGDLLISARHMSTVFLYRPSTNRILWYRTGPWMNQHSADFVGDHQISVFDNNVLANAPAGRAFIGQGDVNRVVVFDFGDGSSTEPFADLLRLSRPMTVTGGRARVLPDGGLFVEETESGRHLRFSRSALQWSRLNDYDARRVGLVSWSRYLTADEAAGPLEALSTRKCQLASGG